MDHIQAVTSSRNRLGLRRGVLMDNSRAVTSPTKVWNAKCQKNFQFFLNFADRPKFRL